VFVAASKKYRMTYNVIPVLIIDNANKMDMKYLKKIQDYAKNASDDGVVTVVFVTSEGSVPRIMMERSSWSRRGDILQIPDVSEKEALDYLKDRCIKEDVDGIYKLAGGRMIDLNFAADEVRNGKKIERMYGCAE
jgi:hypothetical protein